uniref:Uncharacterized protein n=1 Tax=viral metagenome TaxID=1070528 RepID=A0A6M3LPV2_9ZZZZ
MKFALDIIPEKHDYNFIIFHAFGITFIRGKYPYPIFEIHLWMANVDFRFMWWREK